MEQSRRAVESYWRSRMIDGATADEDKVTPVYKLEEVCDLLRSSHPSIVKEVSEFILKRLEHKSPIASKRFIVALRIIKYAIAKSGADFKREMQRNSVAVRQLIHYKGQPDPLKGDSLNKAVRETAKETLSVLFSSDDSAAAPTESSLRSRIQGFGNTNYEVPFEDKRSFISEVVDIGSATIKQGLSSISQSPSVRKSGDNGSYKSPYLQRSLTTESDYSERYEGISTEPYLDARNASRFSEHAGSVSWGHNTSASDLETSSGDSDLISNRKTREEKLLETIVASGGVRLQPTRDALHAFLVEASKLNATSLGHAIELKLRSPQWQIRMKALCVLEAVLRKKEDKHFSAIASSFGKNKDLVVQCSESPQASLREKAIKVLSLLEGEQIGGIYHVEKIINTPQPSMMPDLIDTGSTSNFSVEDSKKTERESKNAAASTALLMHDLLGGDFGSSERTSEQKFEDDPFSDVSFHSSQGKDNAIDVFSGITVDKLGTSETHVSTNKTISEPFDLFNMGPEVLNGHSNPTEEATNLIDGLSIDGNDPAMKNLSHSGKDGNSMNSVFNIYPKISVPSNVLNSEFASQPSGMNANPMFPLGAMASNFTSGVMLNPAFSSQSINGAMGTLYAQQQFLAAMANFHQLGNLQSKTSTSAAGSIGESPSTLPDIFNPGIATQPPTSTMNGLKREETKAFDFISDHLASARDTKRVI